MEMSLTTFALLMPCQQGMDLYMDYYFSIKVQEIEEALRKGVGGSNSACWEIGSDLSVSASSCGSTFFGILAKNCSWFFRSRALGQEIYIMHMARVLAKQAKEWMNISLSNCSEWAFIYFFFMLKFNQGHWLVSWNANGYLVLKKNYNLILLFDQISPKKVVLEGSHSVETTTSMGQQKRLLTMLLAKSLIPVQDNLYSNAFQCHGFLLSLPKQQK